MSNKMWGGRFESAPDAIMEEINASIEFDQILFRQDIAASRAHVAMLSEAGTAAVHAAAVMPGFTHLQPAQPVTFGHHLLAFVEMLERDRGRFRDARQRMNECPLGAAALAGTSFPI